MTGRPAWLWSVCTALAAAAACWLLAAVALLLAHARGTALAAGAATLTAAATGGRVSYIGLLLSDPHGATVAGWPLTLTAVAFGVLALSAAHRARTASRGDLALLVATYTAVQLGLAYAGRFAASTAGGQRLRFSAAPLPAAGGAAVLAILAATAAAVATRPDRLPTAVRTWRKSLAAPLAAAAAPAVVASAGALLLVGYASGDGGLGRAAALALAVPNIAGALLLLAFGVPIGVTSSNGGLLTAVPLLGTEVAADGSGRGSLTLVRLVDAHAGFVVLPVTVTVVLLAAAVWLLLRTGLRPVRATGLLAGTLAVTVTVAAALTRVRVDLHGGGSAVPLAGTAAAPPGWALAAGLLWGALAGCAAAIVLRCAPADAVAGLHERIGAGNAERRAAGPGVPAGDAPLDEADAADPQRTTRLTEGLRDQP